LPVLTPAATHYCYFLHTDSRTHGAGLISVPTHGDKAAAVRHHRSLLPVVCEWLPNEGVHKPPSRLAIRQALESYLLRIRPLLTLHLTRDFYDPVVLDRSTDSDDRH